MVSTDDHQRGCLYSLTGEGTELCQPCRLPRVLLLSLLHLLQRLGRPAGSTKESGFLVWDWELLWPPLAELVPRQPPCRHGLGFTRALNQRVLPLPPRFSSRKGSSTVQPHLRPVCFL